MGPPKAPPNRLYRRAGLGTPVRLLLHSLAFNASFRKNSKALPWYEFVPDLIVVALIVVHHVQDVVVCLLLITVDIGATNLKRVLTRSKRPLIRAYGPGREKSELIVVSSDQRNVFRDDVIDMSANVGGVRLKQRGRASYFDALRHGAYGHLHIDSRNLAQDELKGRAHRRLEPLRFY